MAHRVANEVKRFGRKLSEESRRIDRQLGLSPPRLPKISIEEISPVAIPETGGNALDALRFRKKRRGRASTIVTGSLIPEDVGTKSLLG